MFQRFCAFAQTTTYLGVAVIASIWCGVFFLTHEEHERAYQDGVRQGSNLTRVFEEYVSRLIGGADSVLLTLRDSYQRDPKNFDIERLASRARAQNDPIVQFGIVGLDGFVKLSGMQATPLVSDREYFRFHANSMADELHISAPMVGRASGSRFFQLKQRPL
jgi:hypothetical protein